MNILLGQVWDSIVSTFNNIFAGIGQTFGGNAVVAVLTFALLLILIIYRVIRNRYVTEFKTYRAISEINEYLSKNPFITEENIVEFNRIMMRSPKAIRFQWQRYIINRDKKPSEFLSEENCLTRPLRTNSYKQGSRSFLTVSLIIVAFSAIFSIASFVNIENSVGLVLRSLITPTLALFVSLIFLGFSNILYNAIMSDLYYSYTNFEKLIDRAVSNMPEAIDYEIIFTPKEIKNGIPALQEFLEQRALFEQEQIRKAKESEVEHETYNFDDLKVDVKLLAQRAIKETEIHIGNKRKLRDEIETIKSDRASVEKEFNEENSGYQRNLRDIREEIAKFKAQIEVATNEIQRSNLRRQQAASVEKAESVEKEIEKATKKFNDKVSKLDAEIKVKEEEIANSKIIVEKAIADEFKHFSDKTYDDLKVVAEEKVQEKVKALAQEKDELSLVIEQKEKNMADKLALFEDKADGFDKLNEENEDNKNAIYELKNQVSLLNAEIENKNYEIFEVKKELESRKREILKKDELIENYKKKNPVEIYRYFDANGNEFYFDDEQNPYYLDENGNAVYYDNNETVAEEEYVENVEEVENVDEVLESENLTEEENISEEEQISEETEVPIKKTSTKKKTNSKASDAKKSGTTKKKKETSEIEVTLNKLAKAAEENMKKTKSSEKKSADTKKSTSAKKTSGEKKTSTKTSSASKTKKKK